MKFYLVRHGEKARGDYYNHLLRHNDQPINASGRKQALKIRKYFSNHSIKAIYVSEYIRTEQTVQPLSRKLNLVPIKDHRLNEVDNGVIDNLSQKELKELYPGIWTTYIDQKRDFRWPEGETGLEAQERIVGFMNDHIDEEDDYLIVAHDGIIRILVCYILGLPVYWRFRFQVDTASITEIDWDNNRQRWKLIRFNQSLY